MVDAFPLDRTETADSDGDGIGDGEDEDDDGDGVPDDADAFPLYPGEWADTDNDGIGDETDQDDDNDGRDDRYDPEPTLAGRTAPMLRFAGRIERLQRQWLRIRGSTNRATHVTYPGGRGVRQWFGEVSLGDGHSPPFHYMVDSLGDDAAWAYFDRNGNADLTDDGPPQVLLGDSPATPVFDVAYRSSVVVPYSLRIHFEYNAEGQLEAVLGVPNSSWQGHVDVVDGKRVAVQVKDVDADGVFTGQLDVVCVDVDGDEEWQDCFDGTERFTHGSRFDLRDRTVEVRVATSGHRVEIGTPSLSVPYVPAASHPDWQGFVQLSNRGDDDGVVEIHAYDDAGVAYGPLTLEVGAHATQFFNSNDLEQGNPGKGLDGATGTGEGAWRLAISSDLDLEVLTYVRTSDGFLTRMHDVARRDGDGIRVPTFNPASNTNQVSVLRLVNPTSAVAAVTIHGFDDDGGSPGGSVQLDVPARGAREVTSAELEAGASGLSGALGDGRGKWRLSVMSEQPVAAMSLLRSPTGHVTNLSSPPYEDGGPEHHVSLIPPAADSARQGFVRIVNRSERAGEVTLVGYDDEGERRGPVVFSIRANATVHFNSSDLEHGNADKGLASGLGTGSGSWSLEIESDLPLDVLGYVRTTDGFLTSMHDAFHRDETGIRIPTFNPGSNTNQVSVLRLVNPGDEVRLVSITGVDQEGLSPGTPVRLSIPPRAARTVTAQELESGSAANGLTGALGDGDGKWRLTLEPDGPLRAMSLLRSAGKLTNLSTLPAQFPSAWMATNGTVATTEQTGRATRASAEYTDMEPVVTDMIVIPTDTMGRVHYPSERL